MVGFMIVCTTPALIWVRGDRHAIADADRRDVDRRDVDRDVDCDVDRDVGIDVGIDLGGPGFDDVRAALRSPDVRRWLLASSAAMAGLVAIQVHHVGAIEATGVSIGLASTMAGIRGFLSLPGRAAASTVTGKVGVVNALRITYAIMTLGTLALVVAGAIAWVWVFVVLTGVAFGSISPLQGLYAADLYGRRRIGSLMGMQQLVLGTASAAGPFLLGFTIDATGSYTTLLVTATALQVIALVSYRDPT